jgi:hypothetical protein
VSRSKIIVEQHFSLTEQQLKVLAKTLAVHTVARTGLQHYHRREQRALWSHFRRMLLQLHSERGNPAGFGITVPAAPISFVPGERGSSNSTC